MAEEVSGLIRVWPGALETVLTDRVDPNPWHRPIGAEDLTP